MRIFVFLLLIIPLAGSSQNYAPKDYVLLDSLELDALSHGDQKLIDSCLGIYHAAASDTTRIGAINVIIEQCESEEVWPMYNDWLFDFIKSKLSQSDDLAVTRYFEVALVNSLNNRGYYQLNHGLISKALTSYNKAIELATRIGDDKGLSIALTSSGLIYENQGDIARALENYGRSISIQERIGDKHGLATTLNNIAFIYDRQKDYKSALEYYHHSSQYYTEIDDQQGIANVLNNIGSVYKSEGDLDKALEYYSKCRKIRTETKDYKGLAYVLGNLGQVYEEQENLYKALEFYEMALEIRRDIKDKSGTSNSLAQIARMYLMQEKYDVALEFGHQSLILGQELGFPGNQRQAAKVLSEIYEAVGDAPAAFEHYKLFVLMDDSLNNERTQQATAKQQARYEYEKQKAKDDAEHEKELALRQKAKEKQDIIIYATVGGISLLVIFLLVVINRLKVTRRQKIIIEKQKQKVEDQKVTVEKANKELELKNKEITDSINYAKRIQRAILPPDSLVKAHLKSSFVLYKPKDIVAGDFYWLEVNADTVLFAVADCTGHGVPGAMVSVVCNNALNRSVREYGLTLPGEILDKTREIVLQEFEKSAEEVQDGMDIALCSLEGKTLRYAGAHNPLWLVRKDTEVVEERKANKQPVGKFEDHTAYTTHTIELNEGDTVYLFSDGYPDQFGGERGKKYKTSNFRKLLLSIQNAELQQQKELLDQAFNDWKGKLEQVDDVCVIGVKV